MLVPIFLPHLGCHERCIYCNQTHITHLRENNVQEAIRKAMTDHEGQIEIGLFGGNIFGVDAGQLKRLFSYFDEYEHRISNFRISTKPVPLTAEVIEMLKTNRVTVVELGIPTFNDAILSSVNRGHTVQDLISTYEALVSEGFRVAFQFMVGLPGEAMEDIRETVQNMVRLKPDYIRIYPLVVLGNTTLGEMYKEGAFTPIPFDAALDRATFIYLHALRNNIKVVKMGLTDNEVMKENVLAGHYHPAFGYLVKSRAFCLAVLARLRAVRMKGANVAVYLNERDIPHLVGNKRGNIARFEQEGLSVTWEKREIERNNFAVWCDGRSMTGNIFDALELL